MSKNRNPKQPDWGNLTREDLERGYVKRLNQRLFGKPDIRLVEIDGHRAVHKDIREKPGLLRHTIGSWLIKREYRIYRQLPDCPGVPRLHGRPDRWGILMEYVDGEALRREDPRVQDPTFFNRLCHLVEGLHARGVVHLDLRHRGNIMITRDGKPYVIDFNGSLYLGGSVLGRSLLHWLKTIDSFGLLKLKQRVTPNLLTQQEKAKLRWFHLMRRLWIIKRHRPQAEKTRRWSKPRSDDRRVEGRAAWLEDGFTETWDMAILPP
jgi:hypothetical protein